jgi:thiosulfate/3-mercaptopyruvate sulfurtransferase
MTRLLKYAHFGLAGWLLLFSLAARAAPDFLVDAAWLEQHRADEKLVILEARYHPHRYYTMGHIEGAVQVRRFKDLGDNRGDPLMRFPSREAFQATLRRWGVNNDSTVLVYDDSSTALASRVVFLLSLYGFPAEQIKLLNGGLVEWSAFNELSKALVTPEEGTVTLKDADPGLFVEWTEVYDDVVARRDPGVVLVDARPSSHYSGAEIHHAVRGGHIPGAINIVSLDGTDGQTQTWHSVEKLAALYQSVPKDKTVYVYCHDGFRMSLAWLQLKSLGYADVRLYNGGWSHWGNALALPVVQGAEPLDMDFSL